MNRITTTLASLALITICVVGAWVSLDAAQAIVAQTSMTAYASIGCSSDVCIPPQLDGTLFFAGYILSPLTGTIPGGEGGGTPTPTPPSCTLTADPTSVTAGGTSTLHWSLSDFTNFTLTNFSIVNPSTVQSVTSDCSSLGYQYQDCPLNVSIASVQSITVVQQYSYCSNKSPYGTQDCIPQLGVNYGVTGNHLWVDKGFRAKFAISYVSPGSPTPVTSGTGPGAGTVSGTTVVSPTTTTTYGISVTGTDGTTAQCSTTVTVTPPPNGCIEILKETYDTNGNILTPVAQFTFDLDGHAATTQNDASGNAVFTNVTPGTHTVTEEDAGPNWKLLQSTPQNGHVVVVADHACAAISFKNQQVVTPPPPPPPQITVDATKIVCNNEADLPNWSGTNHTITATTATDYVAAHPDCHLQSGWTFEWASGGASNPGDNLGAGGTGWNAFGPTDAHGVATVDASSFTGGMIWVREQMQSGFLHFTGVGGSNVSPEMYCSSDVLNYDNFDKISNPTAGNTYYCVAWNVPTPPPTGQGCINVVKQTYDTNNHLLTPTAQFTFHLDGTAATVQNDANGNAQFTNVTPGTHTVTEDAGGPNWTQMSVAPTGGTVTVTAGSSCSTVTFQNKQVLIPTDLCPNIDGVQTSIPDGDTLVNGQCVPPPPPSGPSCTLSISASTINPGGTVDISWTSTNATTGSIDNNVGTVTPVAGGSVDGIFPPSSLTYTGTFGNGTATTTCSVPVTVTTPSCTSNCGGGGGGPDQPDVALYNTPNPQPLAFVSLSQVPYTGFAAGPLLTLAFWLAVALWSAAIAYVLMGRQSMRLIAERVFSFAPAVVEYNEGAYGEDVPPPMRTEPVVMSVATQMPAISVMPMPATSVAPRAAAAMPASPGIPDMADVIETRAHAAGVLLSPEALSMALTLASDRAENLRIFGDVLNEAVRSVPREDGWILLSSDRFSDLAQKFASTSAATTAAPMTSVATPIQAVDDAAASQLAQAAVSGNRESAFSLIRTAEAGGMNPLPLMTGVATILDQLYHARRDGTRIADVALQEKASGISDEALEKMVELFTHATGKAYASPYTGVKLALAQAFEVRA